MIKSASHEAANGADLKRTRRRRTAAPLVDKLPPHSLDMEIGTLGCAVISPENCLPEIIKVLQGRSDAFYDERNRIIFEALVEMLKAGAKIDTLTLHQHLKDDAMIEEAGGHGYISELANAVPSAANLSYYLEKVQEKYLLRKIVHTCSSVVSRVYDFEGDVDALTDGVRKDLDAVFEVRNKNIVDSATWNELLEFDTDHDSNTVIGMHQGKTTRYLCKGHGAWLIGPSGVGKSSLMFQFGVSFACGKPLWGVTPTRALRVLLVQAENDKGDLAEMARGIRDGLKIDYFENEELFNLAEKNIRIRSVTGKIGQQFCEWLKSEIIDFGAELVLVDPLLSFAGIDVSRQDQTSQFLRIWLDPVLRETKAVLLSVHHTGKPQAKGRNEMPQTIYDLMYAGMGSSELVNWARAVMLLQPSSDGLFRLVLAKRGSRAWATHPSSETNIGEKTTTVWIRHATDGKLFWEQVDPPQEPEKQPKEQKLTKPQIIAGLNSHTLLLNLSEPISLREMVRRLKAWLSSKDCPKKMVGVSDGTCRSAIELMLESGKLASNELGYCKGETA